MTQEEVALLLDEHGYVITTERHLPDGTGWQCDLASGQIISLFDDGNWNVHGMNSDAIESLFLDEQSENWQ